MRQTTSQVRFLFGVLLVVLLAVCTTSSTATPRIQKTGTAKSIAKPKTQKARVVINSRGYQPSSLKLRLGVPALVTFLRTTDATCAKEIVLRDFNIRRALPLNEPVVISFTPTEKGEFTFACGMNMMRGQLIVQ